MLHQKIVGILLKRTTIPNKMQSKQSFLLADAFMKESCLMGVGDGVYNMCCFMTNTTIVPACTCLLSVSLHT